MKPNVVDVLKRNGCSDQKWIEPKLHLPMLILVASALALGGCETTDFGSSPPPGAVVASSSAAAYGQSSYAGDLGFAVGLDGRWYHDDRPTSISVSGQNVTVIDEVGRRTDGYATAPGEFYIPRDNLRGRLSHDGRRISWTNGGEWTREPHKGGSDVSQGLSGRWYHDGKPTSIEVAPDGRNVTVIDEVGRRTVGSVTSPGEFYIPQDHLRGHLSHDGRRISWSNGGEWTR